MTSCLLAIQWWRHGDRSAIWSVHSYTTDACVIRICNKRDTDGQKQSSPIIRHFLPKMTIEFFTINDLSVSARSGRYKSEFYDCLSVDTWYLKIQVHSRTSLYWFLSLPFTSAQLQKIIIHICQIWQKLPNTLSRKTRLTWCKPFNQGFRKLNKALRREERKKFGKINKKTTASSVARTQDILWSTLILVQPC